MKLAFIAPTKYLHTFSAKGDFYLALAHLIDDSGKNEYTQFHISEKKKGKTIYLDNGLFEGAQVDPKTLIHRAKLIKADVVCAPDVLYESKPTITEFKKFIKLKYEEGLVAKVMGIPQADNPNEWYQCFHFMDSSKECDMIGLSILSVPKSFQSVLKYYPSDMKQPITHSRAHLIEQLYLSSYLSGKRLTPIHMLGLGESYDDIKAAKRYLPRDIVSNDSSSAYVHGMHGILYDNYGRIPGGKIKTPVDFNETNVNEFNMKAVLKNIDKAKEIASERKYKEII